MQLELQPIKVLTTQEKTFGVIILKVKTNFEQTVLGNSFSYWIEQSVKGHNFLTIEYDENNDIMKWIVPYLLPCDFNIVLYSTTPLITAQTVKDIKEYVLCKQSSLCTLPKGYVFETLNIKENKQNIIDNLYSQNLQDFFEVKNFKDLEVTQNILQQRIFSYLQHNGVELFNTSNLYIEPTVTIGSSTKVYGNCIIEGKTVIGNNCIIKENCRINNSIINDKTMLSNCEVHNSTLKNSCIVMPFSYIINSVLESNVMIKSNNRIEGMVIKSNGVD